jgi:cupin superfamily acireductone dioxygenase involved in methionine salvage
VPRTQVRFALEGGVIWDIRERGPGEHWIRIHVYAGEAAIIPKHSWHRMFLLPHPTYVRMMRIYKDELGWQATYRDELPAGKQEL